ncbi:MAG: hypothetical protein QXF15_00655 [Candidatus Aenigmatarchaeota archaeon]|nr:hypothetical protein [Candidatus Aenigmarchaeota archaeon]
MPIVGFLLNEVSGKKITEIQGGVSVANNADIKSVKKEQIKKFNQDAISIGFEFSSTYTSEDEEIAKIIMKGNLIAIDEDTDKILEFWKKNKELPENLHIEAINIILRKCLTKIMLISDELQLPPPIGLPFATKKEK